MKKWLLTLIFTVIFTLFFTGFVLPNPDEPVFVLDPTYTVAKDWREAPEELKQNTAEMMSELMGAQSVATPDFVYDYIDQFYKEFPGEKYEVTLLKLFMWLYARCGPPVIEDHPDDMIAEGINAIWEI